MTSNHLIMVRFHVGAQWYNHNMAFGLRTFPDSAKRSDLLRVIDDVSPTPTHLADSLRYFASMRPEPKRDRLKEFMDNKLKKEKA